MDFKAVQGFTDVLILSCLLLKREPDHEEQPDDNMPPKFKRHLNDDEVTGSIRSERVRRDCRSDDLCGLASDLPQHIFVLKNKMK